MPKRKSLMKPPSSPCLLKATPNPFTYTASAGQLTLIVTSTQGTVTLDPGATSVTDGSGQGPAKYNCTPNQLTFALASKNTYTVDIWFRFIDPAHDTGELKESCPAPALDDNVDVTFTPIYTIVVN